MSKKLYMDMDVDIAAVETSVVAVVGYGTQGTARAMNMRDSGLKVIIGADRSHPEWERAEADGFNVFPVEEAAAMAEIFEIEIPDMAYRCAKAYNERIKPHARGDHMVCLSSAFNYFFNHMDLPDTADAAVTAAKGPGASVRTSYLEGSGVPALFAVHQDGTGNAWSRGLALCKAMGFTRVGTQASTVEEETVTDLLGEHCAWGCIVALLKTVYEVMVEAGYDPEVAFYEAVNESKLTTDLIYKYGMAGMFERISNTAAYGAMTVGPQIIDESVKNKIRRAMENIKNGGFDRDWYRDYQADYPEYKKRLTEMAEHPADVVGNQVRKRLGVIKAEEFSITNPLK